MSLIYFAGKYKISELSQNLLEVLKNSTDEELCQMAVWSLHKIGDDASCKELQGLLEMHSSDKIREYCIFLNGIREYEKAIAIRD